MADNQTKRDMKTLTIGGVQYVIYDENARKSIVSLTNEVNAMGQRIDDTSSQLRTEVQNSIEALQKEMDDAISDMTGGINTTSQSLIADVNQNKNDIADLKSSMSEIEGEFEIVKAATINPDKTLTVSGAAADAKTVGDKISTLTTTTNEISGSLQTLNSKAVKSINNKTADSNGNVTITSNDLGGLIVSNSSEGQILSVDASGKIVSTNKTIDALGTGANYELQGTTLYITTL